MLLRGSGQTHGSAVNLSSVVDGQTESGVPHGAVLIAFADALLGNDEAALESARSHVLQDLGLTVGLPGTAVTWLLWGGWLVLPAAISGVLLSRRKVV